MKDNYKYILDKSYSKKTSKILNQFWAGFIIYTTSYMLDVSGVTFSYIGYNILYLEILGLAIFIIPAIRLIRFKIQNTYLKNLYIIYYAWLFFIIIRGFSFNYLYLRATFTDAYFGIFLYLVPLILLFPKDIVYLKKVITVILILSVIYILCDMVFIKALLTSNSDSEEGKTIIEYFSKILAIPSGFILLTLSYHNDKRKFRAIVGKLWVLFVIFITFLFAVIRARRGLIFMSLNILFFTYIIYNYVHKSNLFFKFFPLLIIFFVSIYAINVYNEKKPGMFGLITERLNEDTRSLVENFFYLDMNKKDWVIGKGIEGSYFCPTSDTEDSIRKVIETDYLQIILKGGIISLGLLLLITVPAIFKGLFYSKNILSKAAAIWILLWLIDLYPATVTTFTLNYILVWISVGICYSKEIRCMPEEIVKEQFQYKIF